jgi:Fe-S-cluster containining protein
VADEHHTVERGVGLAGVEPPVRVLKVIGTPWFKIIDGPESFSTASTNLLRNRKARSDYLAHSHKQSRRKRARADKLRLVQLDAHMTKPSLDALAHSMGVSPLALYKTKDIMAYGIASDTDVLRATSTIQNVTELMLRGRITNSTHKPACQTNCSWCCHMTVVTAIPEIFLLIQYLISHLSADQYQDRLTSIKTAYDAWMGIPGRAYRNTNIRCPLLEGGDTDGACSVYPSRPLACRGWNSYDVEACKHT